LLIAIDIKEGILVEIGDSRAKRDAILAVWSYIARDEFPRAKR
jgi:hypothetical protein